MAFIECICWFVIQGSWPVHHLPPLPPGLPHHDVLVLRALIRIMLMNEWVYLLKLLDTLLGLPVSLWHFTKYPLIWLACSPFPQWFLKYLRKRDDSEPAQGEPKKRKTNGWNDAIWYPRFRMATVERRREKKREQVQAEQNAYTWSILMRCLFMCCFMCLVVIASSAAGALESQRQVTETCLEKRTKIHGFTAWTNQERFPALRKYGIHSTEVWDPYNIASSMTDFSMTPYVKM